MTLGPVPLGPEAGAGAEAAVPTPAVPAPVAPGEPAEPAAAAPAPAKPAGEKRKAQLRRDQPAKRKGKRQGKAGEAREAKPEEEVRLVALDEEDLAESRRPVRVSRTRKAPGMAITEDGLHVSSEKGYRMVSGLGGAARAAGADRGRSRRRGPRTERLWGPGTSRSSWCTSGTLGTRGSGSRPGRPSCRRR